MATVSASHYSAATAATGSTFTVTTASFTPTASSLLVAAWWLATDLATTGETLTVSSSHTGVGAWSNVATAEVTTFSTYATVVGVAVATVGASPSSGTLTLTHRSGTAYRLIAATVRDITDVAGLRSGQTDTETGTTTSPTLTLPASMLSTSVAVSLTFATNDGTVTLPSGWTDWGSLDSGGGDRLAAAYNAAPSGTSVAWSSVGTGSDPNPTLVVELEVPSGHPAAKRWGGIPHASGSRGRW